SDGLSVLLDFSLLSSFFSDISLVFGTSLGFTFPFFFIYTSYFIFFSILSLAI
ncbi:hypothetical protein HMPREF0072_0116, partial [Anaerococcus lactolyticus ATCC 51172]